MPNLSFPKAKRLSAPVEFDRVRRLGDRLRGNLLSVAWHRTDNGPWRTGIVTSRKVGSAVLRNRVRRRLREIVRKHQHAIVPSAWIVIIAAPAAAGASSSELEAEWLRLARRASILAP